MKKLFRVLLLLLSCGFSLGQTSAPAPTLVSIYREWETKSDHIQRRLEEVKHHVRTENGGFTDMTPAQFATVKAQADKDQVALAVQMRAQVADLGKFADLTGNYSLQDLKKVALP